MVESFESLHDLVLVVDIMNLIWLWIDFGGVGKEGGSMVQGRVWAKFARAKNLSPCS